MKRIIQFLHPGGEHSVDRWLSASEGWKDWNCLPDHRRKFLLATGSLTQTPQAPPAPSSLTFWGEWEPQSRVRAISAGNDGYPRWLHTPSLDLSFLKTASVRAAISCNTAAPQNTDPLVFGDRFRYVLCRQISQINGAWKHTILASLNIGDIILFGSCIDNRSKFALDTVFVVDIHTLLRPNGALPAWESNLHRDVTMTVIQIPAVGLRLYGSKTWSPDQPFSFVPCLPAAPRPAVFRRPVIEPFGPLEGIIKPTHVMGYKISTLDDRSARAAWMAVVKQVMDQGCYLGTAIDEPS